MKNIIYIILISLFLVSCDMETVIDLEIPEQDNMLVLNGLLDTDTNVQLLISHTVGAFSNTIPSFISDAEVELYKEDELIGIIEPDLTEPTYVYYYDGSWWGEDSVLMYYYKSEHIPEKGSTYKVKVNHPNYVNVEASTYIPIDVDLYDFNIDTNFNDNNDIQARLTFSFDDIQDQQNYYRLKLFSSCLKEWVDEFGYDEEWRERGATEMMSNDPSFPGNIFNVFSGYTFTGNKVIFTDALFNGQSKTITVDIMSPFKYDDCDTLIIEFSTFSDDTYSYYNSLGEHREKGELGLFGGEVIPVYSNVVNGMGVLISTNSQKIYIKP